MPEQAYKGAEGEKMVYEGKKADYGIYSPKKTLFAREHWENYPLQMKKHEPIRVPPSRLEKIAKPTAESRHRANLLLTKR